MSDIVKDALSDDPVIADVINNDPATGGYVSRAIAFNTHFSRHRQGGSTNSGQLITEAAGYIPAEQQILGMIAAGLRLEEYRKEAYDWSPDDKIDDDAIDEMPNVLRTKGIDPADVSQIDLSLKSRAKRADKLRRKAELEAKRKAAAAAEAVPDSPKEA